MVNWKLSLQAFRLILDYLQYVFLCLRPMMATSAYTSPGMLHFFKQHFKLSRTKHAVKLKWFHVFLGSNRSFWSETVCAVQPAFEERKECRHIVLMFGMRLCIRDSRLDSTEKSGCRKIAYMSHVLNQLSVLTSSWTTLKVP